MQKSSSRTRHCIYGVSFFLLCQYLAGLYRLAFSSSAMDNKFSALAREKHLLFLLGENLYALIAYTLLGCVLYFLIMPLWQRWESSSSRRGLWSILRAFIITWGLHIFCLLRLSRTRPYFLHEAEYGQWYHHLYSALPSWLAYFTFTLLPIAYLIFAIGWHLYRWKSHNRPHRIAIATLTSLLLITFAPSLIPQTKPPLTANSSEKTWNVLIIGSDSLRGDRLGFTGYRPQRSDGPAAVGVSPTIDALAAQSQVFTHCFTPIASTLESNTSMGASLYPHSHGFRHMYPGREQVTSTKQIIQPLANILREKGYRTAAIGDWCAGFYQMMPLGHEDISVSSFDSFQIYMSQAVILAHFVIPLYFDNTVGYRLFPEIQSFAQFVTPEIVTSRVEKKIATMASSGQPFYSHVFYSCNHLPYRTMEPYNSMFADPTYKGKNKTSVDFDIDEFIGGTDLENKWNKLTPADARQISALYDGCTRQFDDCVKRILDSLKKHGLDQNTIVIINSDHGDDLYEPGATLGHGLSFHGGDQSNHIPLIVYVPGLPPQTFPQIVRSIDIAPSITKLVNAPTPTSWEGKSFASWFHKPTEARSRPFYAETGFPFIQFRVENVERPKLPPMDELNFIDETYDYHFVLRPEYEQPLVDAKERMLRTENWKIILTPTASGGRHYRLYHIAQDKHCEQNVAADHPEVLAAMQKALDRWVDQRTESSIAEIFPQGEP
jgi:arylsulfatase A-like enzyme